MTQYIDGFVLPIAKSRLKKYQQVASEVAQIWKEHGAMEYLEFVGDDMNLQGTRSFSDLVAAQKNEVIIFGWVVFPSREVRDVVCDKVANDSRMSAIINEEEIGFDAKRMAYGGFMPLVIQ